MKEERFHDKTITKYCAGNLPGADLNARNRNNSFCGVKAVIKEGSTETNINNKITFYTSKTVELTQGHPFTTTGKKVVEIRYNGEKIAEYTIVITEN